MKFITHASPNFDERPQTANIDMLVLHYTGMPSASGALARLVEKEAKVSAHYLVDENGDVFHLVEETKRAWHAGKSSWRGRESLNDYSVGIEIVNPGHEFGYCPFPAKQIKAVVELSKSIVKRHAIPPIHVVAHSDIAPSRKEDPGELFPFATLAKAGIGIWPTIDAPKANNVEVRPGESGPHVKSLQTQLNDFGYSIKTSGVWDLATHYAVVAFQRRFTPACLDGIWRTQHDAYLDDMLKQTRAS